MSIPGAYTPHGETLSYGELARLADAEARTRRSIADDLRPSADALGLGLIDNLLGGIASAIRGVVVPPAFSDVRDAYQDGQRDLIGRIDLLDGLRGYAHAYMSVNVNAAWSVSNNRMLPFRAQLGPSRGATVLTDADGGIRLEEEGAWLVGVKATARGTLYTGSNEVYVETRVFYPDGQLLSYARTRAQPGTASVSVTATTAIVAPVPGCIIRVETWTGRWRWWDGGSAWSSLWAVKQDNRTDNLGTPTVPDETRP